MKNNTDNAFHTPDKRLAAVCGLFCPACTIFIGTREDPDRLDAIASRFRHPVEELRCNGCRTDRRCFFCMSKCRMTICAAEKGLDFCGECSEYPCKELKAFQAEMPHRLELWQSQLRIKEVGYEKWYLEMIAHYSCKKCGTINSAYDLACRKCGARPGCGYVGLHKEEIMRHIKNRK